MRSEHRRIQADKVKFKPITDSWQRLRSTPQHLSLMDHMKRRGRGNPTDQPNPKCASKTTPFCFMFVVHKLQTAHHLHTDVYAINGRQCSGFPAHNGPLRGKGTRETLSSIPCHWGGVIMHLQGQNGPHTCNHSTESIWEPSQPTKCQLQIEW